MIKMKKSDLQPVYPTYNHLSRDVMETPIIKGHHFGFGTLPHPGQPSSSASLNEDEQLRIANGKIALADEYASILY
ncbi:hypothetical protein Bca52824_007462 [Brassica carinata]|uniref:Uncharacterized protein n=1 Tax=Brassica carinata TaxID=52824 RepID=A0A8X7W6B3_BRACI|nr:hypothetical protein Bca52824_007462 [Brassica carinata]